jgi:hypothetical protein
MTTSLERQPRFRQYRGMPDLDAEPVDVEVADWRVTATQTPPTILSAYRQRALLHEHFEEADSSDDVGFLFVAVSRTAEESPSLVTTQRFSPASGGFSVGVLIVPETEVVFIGAGTRLLCYQRDSARWTRR